MHNLIVACVVLLALFGCNSNGNRDVNRFCAATLVFPDDAARINFIDQNADSIVRQTPHLMLTSHPRLAQITLASELDGCPADLDEAFGLRGATQARISDHVATLQQLSAARAAEAQPYDAWDQDSVRQCVGVIAGRTDEDFYPLMSGVVMSGLRDGVVHADGDGIYFSAHEPCSVVERVARSALGSNPSGAARAIHTCANVSHRACGDPTLFSNGVLPAGEVDALFEHRAPEGR